jgi:hypothetical protein
VRADAAGFGAAVCDIAYGSRIGDRKAKRASVRKFIVDFLSAPGIGASTECGELAPIEASKSLLSGYAFVRFS